MVGKLLTLMLCAAALLPPGVCDCGAAAAACAGSPPAVSQASEPTVSKCACRRHKAAVAPVPSTRFSSLTDSQAPHRHSEHAVGCPAVAPVASLPVTSPSTLTGSPFVGLPLWEPIDLAAASGSSIADVPPPIFQTAPLYLSLRVLRI